MDKIKRFKKLIVKLERHLGKVTQVQQKALVHANYLFHASKGLLSRARPRACDCGDALKKKIKFSTKKGRKANPSRKKSLTTDQKLNKIGILSLHKQLDYNKGVFMHMALTNNAPVYISSLHKAPHSSSRNNYLQLPKPRVDLFKASTAFSGALFWKSSSAPQIMSLTQLLQAKPP